MGKFFTDVAKTIANLVIHKVENLGIAMAPLFLRLILIKIFPNQLKSLSNLSDTLISVGVIFHKIFFL